MRFLFRLGLALAMMAIVGARPAAAADHTLPSLAPVCHAATALDRSPEAMLPKSAWTCSSAAPRSDAPAAWLRFERAAWETGAPPREFFSRISRFETITFHAVDTDGTLRSLRLTEADARTFAAGPVFRLPLPAITPETALLLVRIERPHSVPLLSEARVTRDTDKAEWPKISMTLLAMVMGMLVVPLLFGIKFAIALREKFAALHSLMVGAMMVYVMSAGGLATTLLSVPVATMAVLGPLSYAIGGGLSGLFLAHFLEPGAQSRAMRRITIGAGWFTMIVPGFFALQLDATQAFDDRGYFFTYLPFIFVISAALFEAVLRGSRSARFIALAWAPIIIASVERLLRGLGLYVAPASFDQFIYVAVGFEVAILSLAIADRFFALRNERDAALIEARLLEQISTRDALTGLMNRRAIESRFAQLVREGFHTFALIDLDRFKGVNDRHGHQIGDAALVACADAIRAGSDRDSVAVRLGGEEFVVLLRGTRTLERAEALRQAIPLRIASQVPGLEQPVTASMGVIVLADADRHRMQFSEFYARADALMYEAKAAGRNRLAYERLTVFSPAPKAGRTRNRAA